MLYKHDTKRIKVLKYKRNHNRIVHDFITREPCSLTTRVDYEVSLNMKMHRKYLFVRKMHHILQVYVVCYSTIYYPFVGIR